MRSFLISVFISLFLCSCAKQDLSNRVVYKKVEEKIQFDLVDEEKAIHQVEIFLDKIKKKSKKTNINVAYKINKSFFVDKISMKIKGKKFAYLSVKNQINNNDKAKDIIISASYYVVADKKCGTLELANAADFQFGCSLEYNRALSKLNAPVDF